MTGLCDLSSIEGHKEHPLPSLDLWESQNTENSDR